MEKEYLELLKRVLIDFHRLDFPEYNPILNFDNSIKGELLRHLSNFLSKRGIYLSSKIILDKMKISRLSGNDWPSKAESMIGLERMNNIQFCIENILNDGIEGDLIETGVWRGGASIFMKAVLKANKINNRKVWLADSFQGLPQPNDKYLADKGDKHHSFDELKVSVETVVNNFKKYDLLDDNVKFLKGWFKDTLPTLKNERFSLLRLDGDMYESTMDALINLYPLLNKGGYIIIDDWGAVPACKLATEDYRKENNINDEVINIDWTGVYWKKS